MLVDPSARPPLPAPLDSKPLGGCRLAGSREAFDKNELRHWRAVSRRVNCPNTRLEENIGIQENLAEPFFWLWGHTSLMSSRGVHGHGTFQTRPHLPARTNDLLVIDY